MQQFSPLSPSVSRALDAALQQPVQRIQRLTVGDAVYWLKRTESRPSLRWRLQKGDPARALAAEIDALGVLAQLGLPAPRVIAQGPGHLLLSDSGAILAPMVADQNRPLSQRIELCAKAAGVIAAYHRAGVAHGRPKLRDLCLGSNGAITPIDFERFRQPATPRQQALDALLLWHSILQTAQGDPNRTALLNAATEGYKECAGDTRYDAACRLALRTRALAPLLGLVLWLRPHRAELRAAYDLPRML